MSYKPPTTPYEIEAARMLMQRLEDDQPCPRCGGDRLRSTFIGAPYCHADADPDRWLTR